MGKTKCIFILFVAFVLAGVKYGIGRHEWDPDMKDAMEALKVRFDLVIDPLTLLALLTLC